MSAGVCGKRLGFEEIFGFPSSPEPSAKRSRCNRYDSPIPAVDFAFGTDDKLAFLLHLFPSMDREVVETVLRTHHDKIDDAIKSLNALSLGSDPSRFESQKFTTTLDSNVHAAEGYHNSGTSESKAENISNGNLDCESREPQNKPSWTDIFVQEMMNASDWNDIKCRATRVLEAFERDILTRSSDSAEAIGTGQQEIASLKEQLHCLMRENQILKRAVAIQNERNLENEEKLKEVEHLKHALNQYQEQVRSLEMNNYTLKIHLQKAHEANSSIPGRFHPDVF